MKLTSKCILSPGRSREPAQISLSNSQSRRLKRNGSMKGGQASPIFSTGGKKRGCAFENPEPSSPKVTCIGQVRVKTKKQGKRFRTRSKRIGQASFRKIEQNAQVTTNPDLNQQNNQAFQYQNLQQDGLPHRNQRWVHIPLTICEALKAFGAEFNCFLPCRSTCMSSEIHEEEKAAGGKSGYEDGRDSSCAAVSRWLVSLQDDDWKERDIELVVGDEERVERSCQRRYVFDEVEFDEDNANGQGMEDEEAKARVSICIPPKNALLLMRCRSDPVKMAALANKSLESPIRNGQNEDDEDHEGAYVGDEEPYLEEEIERGHVEIERGVILCGESETLEVKASDVHEEHVIPNAEPEAEKAELECDRTQEQLELSALPEIDECKHDEVEAAEEKEEVGGVHVEEEIENIDEVIVDAELLQVEESQLKPLQEQKEELDNEEVQCYALQRSKENVSADPAMSQESQPEDCEAEAKFEDLAEKTEESMEEKEQHQKLNADRTSEEETSETIALDRSIPEDSKPNEPKLSMEVSKDNKRKPGKTVLPDCLLLMMCEPKLSMEVSKETWVCRADFSQRLPQRPVEKIDCGHEPTKQMNTGSKLPPQRPPQRKQQQLVLQPPRSSCSYPEAAATAASTVIENKLVGSNVYEPFVLTRCKSEPRRSSAELAPEPCFWKNRKIEPHRPAPYGIGAAPVGC